MNHIVFDLDGTLADTSKGIYKAFCSASSALDLAPPSYSVFKSFIGPPVSLIYERIYGIASQSHLFTSLFRHYYDNIYYKDYVYYDSLSSSLGELRSLGLTFSVVTNKPTVPARSIIQDLAILSSNVHPIIGIDFFEAFEYSQKSFKSFSISYISGLLHLPLSDMCYVGDTMSDYHSSIDAGVSFIGCAYGFDDSISTTDSFPVISDISFLPFLITQL